MSVQVKVAVSTIIQKNNPSDPTRPLYLMVEEMTEDGLRINQPSGHLESGETPEEGAIREVLEETKHNVYINSLIGVYMFTRASNGASFLRICFHGTVSSVDDSVPEDEDKTKPIWMTYAEIMDREAEHRNPMVRECLENFIDNGYTGVSKHTVKSFFI